MSYSYDRTAASSRYTPLWSKLVQVVDAFDRANEKAKRAEDLISDLEDIALKDEDLSDPQGNKLYGLKQQIEYLRGAFAEVTKATTNLAETYDEANRWFLQQGLK